MLLKVHIALLAACANALPEAVPQGGIRTTTTTRTQIVVSTKPAITTTRTIVTCTSRPITASVTRTTTTTITLPVVTTTRTISSTRTVTGPTSTLIKTTTKPAITITKTATPVTKIVTVTPTPSATKPPAYLQLIVHPDPYCGTSPVAQQYQNPKDDQITVPVAKGGSVCRSFSDGLSSFSFLRLNADSFAAGCRVYYYSEQTCQKPINDGISMSNENKCVNIPKDKGRMFSFQVLCGV